MKKIFAIALCVAMVASLAACGGGAASPAAGDAAEAKTLTGTADGFGGPINVTVTLEGDKITEVKVEGEKETDGIGSKAIEELPAAIVEKGSADVEAISGATVTSDAIIAAVKSALESK